MVVSISVAAADPSLDDYSFDPSLDPPFSSDDDNYSFTFVGNGSCTQAGKTYDSVTFSNIDNVALCGSSRHCGHDQVRGFS